METNTTHQEHDMEPMTSTTLARLLDESGRRFEANVRRLQNEEPGPWPCEVCGDPVDDFDPETGIPSGTHSRCIIFARTSDVEDAEFLLRTDHNGRRSVEGFRNVVAAYRAARRLVDSNAAHTVVEVAEVASGEVHYRAQGALPCRLQGCPEHAA